MKINEIINEDAYIQHNKASYTGNIGFEEVIKFFVIAEKKDPELAQRVEKMIENNQDMNAWKLIQEFLGIKLKGKQFNEEELDELESPEEKKARHQRDLDELERELRAAGYNDADFKKAITARRLRMTRDKFKKGKFETAKNESATAGSTSAGAIASIANPHLSPGKARGNKSYTGSPGKSGTKAPPQPKVVQKKNSNGTIKGAAEVGGNIFGAGAIKRK